jgi:hypothetical protein
MVTCTVSAAPTSALRNQTHVPEILFGTFGQDWFSPRGRRCRTADPKTYTLVCMSPDQEKLEIGGNACSLLLSWRCLQACVDHMHNCIEQSI